MSTPVTITSVNEALNELHEYIDETIDGVNHLSHIYETRLESLEKSISEMKQEFGDIMYQLQLQLKELVQTQQDSQKETRLKVKKIGTFMLSISQKYRNPIKQVSTS